MTDPRPEKPYRMDTIKKPVTQTDYAIWHSTLWDFLKSNSNLKPLLKKDLVWTSGDANNHGFRDDADGENKLTAEQKSDILETILLKIGTYSPKSIFVDITQRSVSYKYIWASIKRVCGFPVPGAQLIQYMCMKNSFDTNGQVTFNDHYWKLRDAKIASLMTVQSGVTFNGRAVTRDEEITPSMENQVVADWLESIGGVKLIKYIGQEYAKELEKTSLYDLQEAIGQQETMKTIIDRMESEEVVKLNRAQFQQGGFKGKKPFNSRKKVQFEERLCYFCKELANGKQKTHNTRDCFLRQKHRGKEGRQSKSFKVDTNNQTDDTQSNSSSEEEDDDFTKMDSLLSDMKTHQ